MGGITLPTPSTPGYTTFTDSNGRKWTACVCLAQWLKVAQRLGIAKGLIRYGLDIIQLTGDSTKSGGTHSKGGAFDVAQCSDEWVAIFREMGAPASWRRTPDQGFSLHCHGVLSGCAHNDPAAYQITAQRRGYNGLGQGAAGTPYAGMWGYGGKDTHPDPKVYRTWQQGITWAETQIAALEDDMAMTPAERAALIADIAKATWEHKLTNRRTQVEYQAGSYVEGGAIWAQDASRDSAKALAQVAALRAAYEALADDPDLTPEQITAAAKAGAQAALDEKITGAVTNLTVDPPA